MQASSTASRRKFGLWSRCIAPIVVTLGIVAAMATTSSRASDSCGDCDGVATAERETYLRRAVTGYPLPSSAIGKRQRGSGSGFFVNNTDLVTNHHVIDGCSGLTARVGEHGNWLAAELIGSDAGRDLAVLRTEASVEPAAVLLAPQSEKAPESLTIVGYPELRRLVVKPVAFEATLERPDRWGEGALFALHAIVRHGHSGSPVIDPNGLVVGVISKRVNPLALYRKTGRVDDENIGIAISAAVLDQFLREKSVPHTMAKAGERVADRPSSGTPAYIAQVGCWK
jgi:S1-C subfamily serine protease